MDCCAPSDHAGIVCPSCGLNGAAVKRITLKSLLHASALETLEPEDLYVFCATSSCSTVYFNKNGMQTFAEHDLKVPVFQKNQRMDVPVCFGFHWTRDRLIRALDISPTPVDRIKTQVQAGRCACEIHNPQGTCCLGNVSAFVRGFKRSMS
ncbi:copper chaperone Copz family protein [Paenibacillus sp. 32352]|uniref:putative iron-sulfur cluster-binding metallochaperone n=1 Tax=Paenibacillus sp. 32352 TaxID=1969111 RepID=UPI0009AEA400|nr:copper chaperone Copz family protein [Paenibacillus sp. 32352]